MFGPDLDDAAPDDPRWERWRHAIGEFRKTGTLPYQPWRQLTAFAPGFHSDHLPWTVLGDTAWSWDGTRWSVLEPQPQHARTSLKSFTFILGTSCEQRHHHDMTYVDDNHTVCDDCGYTM